MTESQNAPVAAALWMLAAMLIIGFIDNYVAVIAQHMGLWQFFILRAAIAIPLVWGMSKLGLGAFWPRRWVPVLGRSFVLTLAMLCYFGALGLMPIAQALAGLFTSPIFVLLLGWAMLGHRFGPWRAVAVLVGFAGVLLVLQPGGAGVSGWLALPVAGGAFYAMSALATRAWCAGESTVCLLAWMLAMQVVVSALVLGGLALWPVPGDGFLTRGWVWPVSESWGLIWLQAVGSVAGVFGIIRAYQLAEASHVSVFEYSVMIWGPLFGWLLFAQAVGPWQGAGIALIIVAGVIIALRSDRLG
jgi:drug/metabolite transporter (DMT)-like permease